MAVIIYVSTPQDHITAHVDRDTESSMTFTVKTLMNVWKPTPATKPAPTMLVATNVTLNKKILHLVGELKIFIKESFSFKTRMPGAVKCRPTVAY